MSALGKNTKDECSINKSNGGASSLTDVMSEALTIFWTMPWPPNSQPLSLDLKNKGGCDHPQTDTHWIARELYFWGFSCEKRYSLPSTSPPSGGGINQMRLSHDPASDQVKKRMAVRIEISIHPGRFIGKPLAAPWSKSPSLNWNS